MQGWEACTSSAAWPERCGPAGRGEESSGVPWWEYSIHMEIPHCSFKIPFPSFKSDSVFLQLIDGYCQMNLGKSGARMSLAAVNVWGFLELEGKGVSSDHLFHSLFA